MTTRHYIASGPHGQTVCSTRKAAAMTLADLYKLDETEQQHLQTFGQFALFQVAPGVWQGLGIEACDCDDPASHIRSKAA